VLPESVNKHRLVVVVVRELVVSDAPVSNVARIVRETVEDEGAIVAQQTTQETEFDNLRLGDENWSRSGYVGTYKRYKEKPVRLRVRVWATWPRRLLLWSVYLGLIVSSLFLLVSLVELSPPTNWWVFSAMGLFALIAAAFLLYTSSIPDSRHVEDEVTRRFAERIEADEDVPGAVYTLDEYEELREELIDEALAEAKQDQPGRATRVKQTLASLTGSEPEPTPASGEPADSGPSASLEEEPAQQVEDPEEEEDADGFMDRLPFGSDDEDEEPEGEADEEAAHEERPDDAADADEDDDGGLLASVPFLGSKEDDEPEGEADEGGLLDSVPFLTSGGDDEPQEEGDDKVEDETDENGGSDERGEDRT